MIRGRTVVARRLRRHDTDVEKRLWRALRGQMSEYRFRRRHPIGRYVVDFACPARKLVVELDGGRHALQEDKEAARTAELVQRSYRQIRLWNDEVMHNLAGVLDAIRRELDAQ